MTAQTLNDYLEQARKFAAEGRFDEALDAIREAYTGANEDELGLIEAVRGEITEARQKRILDRSADLEGLLQKNFDALSQSDLKSDLERGQAILAELQNIHPYPTDLEPLAKRWQAHYQQIEADLDYKITRQELEKLWRSPKLMLSNYDQALTLARKETSKHPASVQFQELLFEAERLRVEAYQKEGDLTTAAAQGNFEPLLAELTTLAKEAQKELPVYEWGTREIEGKLQRGLIISGNEPAQSAIDHLKILAREYNDSKAETYIGQVQADFLPTNPEAAARLIEEALKFKYVSPGKREKLEAFKKDTIEPALETRKQAHELVQQALDLDPKEVEEAWRWLAEAEKIDRFASEISQARGELRPHLKIHLENQLRRAAEKREQAGEFETAQEMAERVRQVAEPDEGLQEINIRAQDLINQCEADGRLLKSLKAEAQRIREIVGTNLVEAVQALADLEKDVAGRPIRFQQVLREARAAVQARQSLEALLASWMRRFQEIDPSRLDEVDAIKRALNELSQLADEVAGIVTTGTRPEVERFQQRLAARQFFLQGRLDWADGLYNRAKRAWQQAHQLGGDDLALVKEWLVQADDAEAVSNAIQQAEEHQKAGKYQAALTCLKEWRTKPSPKQQEVRQLYHQNETEWTTRLEAACVRALAFGDPNYRTLKEMLQKGLEQAASPAIPASPPATTFVRSAEELLGPYLGAARWN